MQTRVKISARLVLTALLGVSSLAQAPAAFAQIVNASFETPAQSAGSFTNTVPPGWTLYDPGNVVTGNALVGVFNPTGAGYYTAPTPDGSNLGYVLLDGGAGTAAGLSQTLSVTLQTNTRYRLQTSIGDPLSAQGFNLSGFPGYAVQVLAGGTLLAQDNNSLAGQFAEGTFVTSVVDFTTGASVANLGQPLQIRLLNLNLGNGPASNEVDFDNVRLTTTAVPEPGSIALLVGLGVTGAGFLVRRRHK